REGSAGLGRLALGGRLVRVARRLAHVTRLTENRLTENPLTHSRLSRSRPTQAPPTRTGRPRPRRPPTTAGWRTSRGGTAPRRRARAARGSARGPSPPRRPRQRPPLLGAGRPRRRRVPE